jgi:archaellum component FlaF (FlaF/FlaG flagellin family)
MKITARRRTAISQSIDLFIIIAAVLAVGGVVTAAIYGLAGSASTNSSIQVVQAAAQGGGATAINSFSITVKNTGSTTISLGTVTVTLRGSVQPASPVTSPTPTCSTGTGSLGGSAASPVQVICSSVTLAPGAQVAISEGPISGLTTGWTPGATYQVTVTLGSAQTSINVIA